MNFKSSVSDVAEWLETCGFGEHMQTFIDNDIDGSILLTSLHLHNLRDDLAIRSLGKRLKLWDAILSLRSPSHLPDPPAEVLSIPVFNPPREQRHYSVDLSDSGTTTKNLIIDPKRGTVDRSTGFTPLVSYLNSNEMDPVLPPYNQSDHEDYDTDSEWENDARGETPPADKQHFDTQTNSKTKQLPLETFDDSNKLASSSEIQNKRAPIRFERSFPLPKKIQSKSLSHQEITDIINTYQQKIILRWTHQKKPTLDAKKHKLYAQYHSNLDSLLAEINDLNTKRLPDLKKGILDGNFTRPQECERMCGVLDESIEFLCELQYAIEVCSGDNPSIPEKKRKRVVNTAGNTVSRHNTLEDEHWSDFIDDDDDEEEENLLTRKFKKKDSFSELFPVKKQKIDPTSTSSEHLSYGASSSNENTSQPEHTPNLSAEELTLLKIQRRLGGRSDTDFESDDEDMADVKKPGEKKIDGEKSTVKSQVKPSVVINLDSDNDDVMEVGEEVSDSIGAILISDDEQLETAEDKEKVEDDEDILGAFENVESKINYMKQVIFDQSSTEPKPLTNAEINLQYDYLFFRSHFLSSRDMMKSSYTESQKNDQCLDAFINPSRRSRNSNSYSGNWNVRSSNNFPAPAYRFADNRGGTSSTSTKTSNILSSTLEESSTSSFTTKKPNFFSTSKIAEKRKELSSSNSSISKVAENQRKETSSTFSSTKTPSKIHRVSPTKKPTTTPPRTSRNLSPQVVIHVIKRPINSDIEERTRGRKKIREIRKESSGVAKKREGRAVEENMIKERIASQREQLMNSKKIMINIGHDDTAVDVFIPDFLGRVLKEHQIEGVQFMWKNIIMVKVDDEDAGCIISHAMGLGKTLQVITFLYTLCEAIKLKLNASIQDHLRTRRILIAVPSSLVSNWCEEFKKWVPKSKIESRFGFVESISAAEDKTDESRLQKVKNWATARKGVLIIGYDLLKLLCDGKNTKSEKPIDDKNFTDLAAQYRYYLLDKGPGLFICDEAHAVKNKVSQLSVLLNTIKTPSRIALTGSPLQNNLAEYWSMVNFAVPNFLGNLKEFGNRYINPIENGRFIDSTDEDRRTSRRKMLLLKKLINPIVQRFDNSLLEKDIPKKMEFALSFKMTPLQRRIYKLYLACSKGTLESKVFLSKLFDHPAAIKIYIDEVRAKYLSKKTNNLIVGDTVTSNRLILDDEPEIDGDYVDGIDVVQNEDEVENDDDVDNLPIETMISQSTFPEELIQIEKIFQEYDNIMDPIHSYRIVALCNLIAEVILKGEKLLLFSQNIPTIEYLTILLAEKHINFSKITGTTGLSTRASIIEKFATSSTSVLVISIRAGGVGFNLPAASRIVLLEVGWNPSIDDQAIGRAFRYGQERRTYVYRFYCEDSFESRLMKGNVHKSSLTRIVIDDESSKNTFNKADTSRYFQIPDEEQETDLDKNKKFDDDVLNAVIARNYDKFCNVYLYDEHFQAVEEDIPTVEDLQESEVAFVAETERRKSARLIAHCNRSSPNASPGNNDATSASSSATVPVSTASIPSSAPLITPSMAAIADEFASIQSHSTRPTQPIKPATYLIRPVIPKKIASASSKSVNPTSQSKPAATSSAKVPQQSKDDKKKDKQ